MESGGENQQAAESSTAGDPTPAEPTAEQFFLEFRAEQHKINEELAVIAPGADKVHETLDALLMRTQALEGLFMRSSHVLPRYDLQQYRSALKALATDIAARREQLAPRKKFSFKRREPAKQAPARVEESGQVEAAPTKTPPAGESLPAADITGAGELFEGLSESLVTRGAGDLGGRDVALKALVGCRVVLLDRIGALHCHGLRRCEILVGAIASSALLYDCKECILRLAAKQLRLHDSDNISLHLHTLSGPVIEHSQRVMVAPFDLKYPELAAHWSAAALGEPAVAAEMAEAAATASAWSDVQDFNWHKRQASPNWRVMPMDMRDARLDLCDVSSFADSPLPPALEDLERCRRCWETIGEVGVDDGDV